MQGAYILIYARALSLSLHILATLIGMQYPFS